METRCIRAKRCCSIEVNTVQDETSYICDACGEEVVIAVDHSVGSSQEFVEDCPVCCRPNVIRIEIDEVSNARSWAELE